MEDRFTGLQAILHAFLWIGGHSMDGSREDQKENKLNVGGEELSTPVGLQLPRRYGRSDSIDRKYHLEPILEEFEDDDIERLSNRRTNLSKPKTAMAYQKTETLLLDLLESFIHIMDRVLETPVDKYAVKFGVLSTFCILIFASFWLLSTTALVLIDTNPALRVTSNEEFSDIALLSNAVSMLFLCFCMPAMIWMAFENQVFIRRDSKIGIFLASFSCAGSFALSFFSVYYGAQDSTFWLFRMTLFLALAFGRAVDLWAIMYVFSRVALAFGYVRNRLLIGASLSFVLFVGASLVVWHRSCADSIIFSSYLSWVGLSNLLMQLCLSFGLAKPVASVPSLSLDSRLDHCQSCSEPARPLPILL